MDKRWSMVLLLGIVLIAACTMPQEDLPPQGEPGALYTEAARTVAAKIPAEGVTDSSTNAVPGTDLPEGSSPLQPSETFTVPTVTPPGTTNGTPMPCDRVRFIKDVTIPDEMDLSPGEAFTKTWRLQNVGSCPWTIGYLLYFKSGNIMGGPTSQYLTSEPVFSGEMIDVSVDLIAPEEIGAYKGNWKLRNVKGEGFGIGEFDKAFWVKINVVEGAGTMFEFNVQADQAAWGFGSTPVDYIELGEETLQFDQPSDPGEPYVALLNEQFLEGGEISGVVLAAYPPRGAGKYVIGRFPSYQVNSGDLLFGRVGLATNFSGECETGDVTFRIPIQIAGDPATKSTLWEWNEVCDSQLKSFEIDLDSYQGEQVEIFLVVIGNADSADNLAIWDSLSIHR